MKKLLTPEGFSAVIAIIATILSMVVFGLEFLNNPPSISGLLVGIVGVILGGAFSIFVIYTFSKKNAAKVFISYSLKDSDFVNKLSNDLNHDGFQVLRLDNVVMVGDNIRDKIVDSIEKADFFVAVISKDALESSWVIDELEFAAQSNKKVFPVLKDQVPLPIEIKSIQYADFTKEYNVAIAVLLKSLRASLHTSKSKSA